MNEVELNGVNSNHNRSHQIKLMDVIEDSYVKAFNSSSSVCMCEQDLSFCRVVNIIFHCILLYLMELLRLILCCIVLYCIGLDRAEYVWTLLNWVGSIAVSVPIMSSLVFQCFVCQY